MRLVLAGLLALWVCPLFAQGQAPTEPVPVRMSREERAKLPRMAFLEFKPAPDCWGGWRHGGWGGEIGTISDRLRDLFSTEIMEKGAHQVRLIDRERLEELRHELELHQSGEVDVATVQKVGKLLGVGYVVTGKVTRFAYKDTWSETQLLGSGVKKASFTGRLDLRLIEVQTGDILSSLQDEGAIEEASVKVLLAGTEIQYDGELVNRLFEPLVQRLTKNLLQAAAGLHAGANASSAR